MSLSQRQLDAIRHILDHCQKAIELAGQIKTQAALEANWQAQYALTRCIEIVGEAATRLGPQFHAEHPAVPWRLVVGMRNRLIHGYDAVDTVKLWQTATVDMPDLLKQMERLKPE